MKYILFPNSVFSIFIVLYSNLNHLMAPLNFNNQKHLQLIDFIKKRGKKVFF